MREAPPSTGGGLRYLGRDASGRAVWTADAASAERHPSLREASRAALTAPPLAGALRPAYAVPVSVADTVDEAQLTPRPALRLVASGGVVIVEATDDPAGLAPPDWPPNPAAWIWIAWAPWIEAWRALVFGAPCDEPRL